MRLITWALAGVILAAASAGTLIAGSSPTAGAKYIGVKKCKMCHGKQFKKWKEMKHAKNFSVLQGKEKKDPKCLKCHTTGFGKGGYDLSKPAEENKKFENVQCEACHGPGSLHFKAPKAKKKLTIERMSTKCSGCHNPHKSFGDEAKKKRGG